ncbi:MAG: hypothetical protein WA001_05045 [Patescibacteria group bacterium]
MPRTRSSRQPNKGVAIFATILVVVGVVAVVAFSSEFNKATTPPSTSNPGTSTVSTQTAGPYASGTVVLVNDSAVTLMRLDATTERVTEDQFTARFAGEALPVEGANVANGAKAYFHLPSASSSSAIPSPDGKTTAAMDDVKSDGATVLDISPVGGSPQTVVLRNAGGQALQDVSFLGWLDSRTLAVSAVATSTSEAYAVSIAGDVTPLAPLPSSMVWDDARGGSIWYGTAVMGQGIESEPQGPSELHRIAADGTDTLMTRDETHVYLTVVPGPNGAFAVTTDDGKSSLLESSTGAVRISLGTSRPLFFLPDGTLLMRTDYTIAVFNPTAQTSKTLGSVPEGQVSAFFLP